MVLQGRGSRWYCKGGGGCGIAREGEEVVLRISLFERFGNLTQEKISKALKNNS